MSDLYAITGGTGLIGSRVVADLLQRGERVRLLSRSVTPSGVEVIRGDLREAAARQQLVAGAHYLIHLGAVAHTDLRNPAEEQAATEINVGATENLLQEAATAGVQRVLLVSSAHVYAGQCGLNLTETSPTAGDSHYAAMKLQGEAAAAATHGLHTVIIRPCITYGAGVRFNLHALMRAVQRGLYVHAGGADAVRSFASVNTVAAATLHLLHHGEPGGVYNVADEAPIRVADWVNTLADSMHVRHPRTVPQPLLRIAAACLTPLAAAGLPAPLTNDKLRKLTASFSLDTSRLRSTGFTWPTDNTQVIADMVQAFLASQVVRP